MKFTFNLEVDVSPAFDQEITTRGQKNISGMLHRLIRHRLHALEGMKAGGDKVPTGEEVVVKGITLNPTSKVK